MRKPKTEWSKERIQALLKTNPIALERAILLVYGNQTASEKASQTTNQDNGVGFNGTDASFMSSLAVYIFKSNRDEGSRLSPKQREIATSIMQKYWGQIQQEIIRKESQKTVVESNTDNGWAEAAGSYDATLASYY